MSQPNSLRLVRRCLAGDQDACAALVARFARLVGTMIWRATGDGAAVEDLAQETFLRVFRGLPYFTARAKLSTWVYTIAHRVDELDARIEAALKGGQDWEPPRDFVQRVAAIAANSSEARPASWRLVPGAVFDAAMPAVLLALAGCGFGLMRDVLVDNVTLVAWLSAGLTLWTAVTFARRAGI